MQLGTVDRPPLFEDGIREEVLDLWRTQGLGKKEKLEAILSFDRREEIETNLDPLPAPSYWPKSLQGFKRFASRLDPDDPKRLPKNWEAMLDAWKKRDYPLILRVHRGYFLSMGVYGWRRFKEAIQLLVDNPSLVETWMNVYGEFYACLADRVLNQVDVDAALFSEPIGGNHGSLISPKMYTSVVLKSYLPLLQVLKQHGVRTIIYRTYANTRILLPDVVQAGFNCLWACECNPSTMDYREIKAEFGGDLRLIGGIDSDSLRQSQQEIRRSIMDMVPGLLQAGGYIPIADGRVREDVTFENYMYYRRLLESITSNL